MDFNHKPVMLIPSVTALNIKPDGIYIDATAGGGSHSAEIAKRLTSGRLIAIDQDPDAVQAATKRLKSYNTAKVVHSNFNRLDQVLAEEGIKKIDGILFDLGVSSHQLDTVGRGFSYHGEAPLDFRMSRQGTTAADLINQITEQELTKILFEYGEEKYARSIARNIVKARVETPIETTAQLNEIISTSVPSVYKRQGHPARKSYQAIRIALNRELEVLEEALQKAFDCMNSDGRIAVISFHSLEDRIVKKRFADWCSGCDCPKEMPVCICGKTPSAKLYNKKPIQADEQELHENQRSRSAKLRVCIKN